LDRCASNAACFVTWSDSRRRRSATSSDTRTFSPYSSQAATSAGSPADHAVRRAFQPLSRVCLRSGIYLICGI
jgi:hypothetical protein